MSGINWPQPDPMGRVRLTYRDGHTGEKVERRYTSRADALAVAFNYFAAEDAEVFDGDVALDMAAEADRFRSSILL